MSLPMGSASTDVSTVRNAEVDRLIDQIEWYDSKSGQAQRLYKRFKLLQLCASAAIPVLAVFSADVRVQVAVLGALLMILESMQQLNQWQSNWILYRSAAEALKRERHLYLAKAGPYRTSLRDQVLVERIEGLISQEHAKWTETRHSSGKAEDGQGGGSLC